MDTEHETEHEGSSIARTEPSTLAAIARSEVEMQLDAAHRWPRLPSKFLREATSLATMDEDTAAACMYSIPRGGKMITGKSVRLAEICASAWGNLHTGARVIDETETAVIAQAVAWDLERNVRLTVEVQRGIRTSKGGKYDADMVRVTGMAAISIAFRNAVFRIIPNAYTDRIYAEARATAVGDAQTLTARRDKWLSHLSKMGVSAERVFARLEVHAIADVSLDHLATLIGIVSAIKAGDIEIDAAFPAVSAAPAGAAPPASAAPPEGRRVSVGTGRPRGRPPGSGKARAAEASAPPAAASPEAPASTPPPAAAPPGLVLTDAMREYHDRDLVYRAPELHTARDREILAAVAAERDAAPSPAQQEIDRAAAEARARIERGETDPATGQPPTRAALLAALETVDPEGWGEGGVDVIVERWSDEQAREAWVWARAVLTDGPMERQVNRPAHTFRT